MNIEGYDVLKTHNSGDGEFVLLGVVEEFEDIITDDNTGLAAEDILNTHICS